MVKSHVVIYFEVSYYENNDNICILSCYSLMFRSVNVPFFISR